MYNLLIDEESLDNSDFDMDEESEISHGYKQMILVLQSQCVLEIATFKIWSLNQRPKIKPNSKNSDQSRCFSDPGRCFSLDSDQGRCFEIRS